MLWTSSLQSPPAPLALALLAAAAETAGALSGIAATVPPTPRGGFICNYRRERGRDEREGGRKKRGRIRPAWWAELEKGISCQTWSLEQL